MELTPLSPRGFVRNSDWTMLVQVPAGNPFQYQYQLSLDGDDTVEVWKNDPADDLTFSPIFTDESDTLLFLHHHPGGTLPPHAAPGVRVHRAGGALRRGPRRREFRINRRGNLLFRARGRGVDLRPVVGGSVRLTLRMGSACARTTMALRTSRKGLVFP